MALRGTLTHWKTRLLATSLDMMPCQALGILEALWHVTAELAPAGNIGRLPNKAIAMEMFYEGDPDALVEALIASGHLDANEEHRLIVHDWSQHADYNTKRKVVRRKESIIANDGSRLVMTRHESIPEPEPEPEPVKKTIAPSATALEAPIVASSPAIGTIPLVDGSNWPFTQTDLDGWKEAYPAVDVLQQLRAMREWCLAHKSRRKTERGIRAFVNSWLCREQDKGRVLPMANQPPKRVYIGQEAAS